MKSNISMKYPDLMLLTQRDIEYHFAVEYFKHELQCLGYSKYQAEGLYMLVKWVTPCSVMSAQMWFDHIMYLVQKYGPDFKTIYLYLAEYLK